ncbi:MAG: hypothetical protein A2504_13105 [Bdellovibrionales bacterium RIFOXYD12_FULL_39_22]|nr:MAG: hypothetical protein A2385_00905 [Bdellovibrionales bacterium RIFOXYB1_FULL_39_21]OFZ43567.1 MAG: hypothetical protein A2485_12575 [Bdellovibrionales bacterium RIFOXYC12_FULL_39_17]OFZ44586.1 MAG: hypothetical protein A2404_10265 [Bdellovibrionales bacterium RIFOXYC1_FULL_39_130]OFZ76345.1 MAG: hypothetical protein A2560_06885 [Bdellovibrionales bacterium RIFOXYD1_FULL_39_84]OFZ94611.1 MAG: hypothetical protein A2504_13105 [Bdellovibrionales bacterium RIFOXYD12_FULL_39_22]HLE12936.1 hy
MKFYGRNNGELGFFRAQIGQIVRDDNGHSVKILMPEKLYFLIQKSSCVRIPLPALWPFALDQKPFYPQWLAMMPSPVGTVATPSVNLLVHQYCPY